MSRRSRPATTNSAASTSVIGESYSDEQFNYGPYTPTLGHMVSISAIDPNEAVVSGTIVKVNSALLTVVTTGTSFSKSRKVVVDRECVKDVKRV